MSGTPSKSISLLISCEVEACSEGERRALARAVVVEAAPHSFLIYPFYLREISGAQVSWTTPPADQPIATDTPIRDLSAASGVLAWWASCTVALCASAKR